MPISIDKVAPDGAAAPAPAPASAPAEPEAKIEPGSEDQLPDEVLKVPAMAALLQGSPPALYAPVDADFPELKELGKYGKELLNAGIGALQTPDGANVVVFNALYVKPEEIEQAVANGTLDQIAVPYEQIRSEFEGAASEPSKAAKASAGEAPASGAPAVPGPSGNPPAPAAQKRMTTARVKNLAPGAPTSGPAPGQGRLLNNILKPTV